GVTHGAGGGGRGRASPPLQGRSLDVRRGPKVPKPRPVQRFRSGGGAKPTDLNPAPRQASMTSTSRAYFSLPSASMVILSWLPAPARSLARDRKSTRLNSSH